MHVCKLFITKLYTSVHEKRLANSRLQTVDDKCVEEVDGDLRDRDYRARFEERRTPGPKGVRRDLVRS